MNTAVENMQFRVVMYIGSKPRKYDSPNGLLDRVWPGTGTIVNTIPATQAAKLVTHKDEFIDVTGWDEQQIQARAQQAIADCAERKRQARALGRQKAEGLNVGILLQHATVEQLEAELEKRHRSGTLAEQTEVAAKPSRAEQNLAQLSEKERTDDDFLRERIPEAMEAILAEEDPTKLDEEGIPTRSAVEELLGFPITEDDYAVHSQP